MNKKKILIIEDDQYLRELYQELLQSEGYSVDTASDGETGFAKLQEGGFSLVLLDMMLPKKDGLQILKDLKTSSTKKPNGLIIALTNMGNDAIKKQCFEFGASGYLIKSDLNPDQVLSEIKSYLPKN